MAKNFTNNIKSRKAKVSAEQSEKIANELHNEHQSKSTKQSPAETPTTAAEPSGRIISKTKALNFNIPMELYQLIHKQAQRKGISKKALITAALWDVFEEK